MVRFARSVTFVAILAIWLLLSQLSGIRVSQAVQQERTYKVWEPNTPQGVLEIKKVGNLQSPLFPQDLEVEVKNISNKPIYYIDIAVLLPEGKLGFHLRYGRRELGHHELGGEFKHAEEKDVPLLPGESAILRVDVEFQQNSLPQFKDNDAEWARVTSHLRLGLQVLHFGDGTGYVTSQPYPDKK